MQRTLPETNPTQVSCGFPSQLFTLLEQVDDAGIAHIVSWRPHGFAFKVQQKEQFAEIVLPRWFRHSNFSSFQRQLSIYGFHRIAEGRDKNSYYNENFVRGHYEWTFHIERNAVKGTRVRKPSNQASHPNFYDQVSRDGNNSAEIVRSASVSSNSSHRETLNGPQGYPLMTGRGLVHSARNQHLRSEFGPDFLLNSVAQQRYLALDAGLASTKSNDYSTVISNNSMNESLPEMLQRSVATTGISSNLARAALHPLDQNTMEALILQLRRPASSNSVPTRLPLLDRKAEDVLLVQLQQLASSNASMLQSGRRGMPPLNQRTLESLILPHTLVVAPIIQSRALIDFRQQPFRNHYRSTLSVRGSITNLYNNNFPAISPEVSGSHTARSISQWDVTVEEASAFLSQ